MAVGTFNDKPHNPIDANALGSAIANERLKRDGEGQVMLQLKRACRDSTTHIVMSPLEVTQRLGDPAARLSH